MFLATRWRPSLETGKGNQGPTSCQSFREMENGNFLSRNSLSWCLLQAVKPVLLKPCLLLLLLCVGGDTAVLLTV